MTKKEIAALRAQIEQYLPELKAEIGGAKNDLKNARTLKTQLEAIVTSSEDLLKKMKDPVQGVNALLASGSSGISAIAANSESAHTMLDQMQSALETATQYVSDMEAAYDNFTDIRKRINDPETGLDVTLTAIKQIRGRAREAATKTESVLKAADTTLAQIQTYIANIDKTYAIFLDSKKKVEDPTEGLEAILAAMKKLRDNISSVADRSTTLFTQINGYKDEAASSLKDINTNKTTSETTLGKIKEHESKSEAAKKNIETLLKIASQKSSTSYFKKRTSFVAWVAGTWLIIGVAALVIAVIVGHELVNDILKNSNISLPTVIARTLVVTPVIAFAFYAFRNYGKERNTAEQYAFKEISGATIEGHVAMAHRAFPESDTIDSKLEDAVINVLQALHSEPSELKKTSRNIFKIKSKLMGIEGEVVDISNDVKNIKKTVTKTESGAA
jgi:predicted  nucleic acid-binding Zn-ribbon protein